MELKTDGVKEYLSLREAELGSKSAVVWEVAGQLSDWRILEGTQLVGGQLLDLWTASLILDNKSETVPLAHCWWVAKYFTQTPLVSLKSDREPLVRTLVGVCEYWGVKTPTTAQQTGLFLYEQKLRAAFAGLEELAVDVQREIEIGKQEYLFPSLYISMCRHLLGREIDHI